MNFKISKKASKKIKMQSQYETIKLSDLYCVRYNDYAIEICAVSDVFPKEYAWKERYIYGNPAFHEIARIIASYIVGGTEDKEKAKKWLENFVYMRSISLAMTLTNDKYKEAEIEFFNKMPEDAAKEKVDDLTEEEFEQFRTMEESKEFLKKHKDE